MSIKTRLLIFFAVIAVVGVVVLYVLEFQWFHNSFGLQKLVLGALAVGLLIGLGLGFRFQKNVDEIEAKMQVWATCIIVPLLLMPLAASLTNRIFAQQPRPVQVEFWEQKAFTVKALPFHFWFIENDKPQEVNYFLFVLRNGELVRLKSKKLHFPTAKKGDIISIPVRTGLFKTEFVDFRKGVD